MIELKHLRTKRTADYQLPGSVKCVQDVSV